MSYRTTINGSQLFGNNEFYGEWIDFIKSQGIKIDDNGNYKGEITDFMSALSVIENITMRLHQERICNQNTKNLFDFRYVPDTVEKDKEDEYGQSLLDAEIDLVSNAYAFLPYQFYTFCKDQLDKEHLFTTPGHVYSFKLKPGETIKVEAH